MNCPNDNTVLIMSDRQGIEIDYCPTCRGVWLDRGELDKIIERSAQLHSTPQHQESRPHYDQQAPVQKESYGHGQHPQQYHKKKKRESFFDDLFDF